MILAKPTNDNATTKGGDALRQGRNWKQGRTFSEIVALVKTDCKTIATVLCVKHRVCVAPRQKKITVKVEFSGQEWREWDDPIRGRTPEGAAYFEPFDAVLRSYNTNRTSTYEWIEYEFDADVKLVKTL
jgi:hypothetical protein